MEEFKQMARKKAPRSGEELAQAENGRRHAKRLSETELAL